MNASRFLLKTLSFLLLSAHAVAQSTPAATTTANIRIYLNKTLEPVKPVWAWFGYDEPNYTYMKDGKKLLSEMAALSSVPVYVRTHSLLVTGDGEAALKWGSTNAYTEDAQGRPVYSWRIVDSIFDTYIKRGMKPLAQIGFMPQALSTHPEPYRHHWKPGDPYNDIITGWAYPPKDYNKWAELVYQWVKHSVQRYGQKEVESWWWEVWNEPNGAYWKGTRDEFFKLYDYTVDAVKRALPMARIGGINVAGTAGGGAQSWLSAFVKHCFADTNYVTGKIGSPVDAVLFHAKGSPSIVNGRVQMGINRQLKDIEAGFKFVASHPQVKNLPVIIGESDPEGCAACGMATNPQNAYRNGTMYSSYTAASFAREYELARDYGVNFIGAVTWAFEFENQPWFYGFRDLATNGVDKPVLNVFRMFGMMKGDLVKVESDKMYGLKEMLDSGVRRATDVGALASKAATSVTVMIWNYGDADIKGDTASVSVIIGHLPSVKAKLTHYRIDDAHSNSYEAWKKMGSPSSPSPEQIKVLEKAGGLGMLSSPQEITVTNGEATIKFALPRQGVSLLKFEW